MHEYGALASEAVLTQERGDHLQERRGRSASPGTIAASGVPPQSRNLASHPELRKAPTECGSWVNGIPRLTKST